MSKNRMDADILAYPQNGILCQKNLKTIGIKVNLKNRISNKRSQTKEAI